MKIFFSTLFDSPSYPVNIFMENGVAVGALHFGPAGLLHFLELYLGIASIESSPIKRIFQYRSKLHGNRENSFYENSFESNELDVATTLLKWRDELKIAGWDFKTDASTPNRLRHLARVEEQSIHPGFADRFRELFKLLQNNKTPLEKIILHEPFDLLPSFCQQLFSILKQSGVEVEERSPEVVINRKTDLGMLQDMVLNKHHPDEKNVLQKDGSIQVLQFGEQLSAANAVAVLLEQDPSFKPVIINESADTSLALALRERGIPYTGQALHAVSHPDLQLLAVMPVWLWKPYSPQQLLDFLLCPFNILPERLCLQWAEDFSNSPGICLEDWLKKIEKYVSKIEDEKAKARPADRLNYLLKAGLQQQERIAIHKVTEYYRYFYNIFNARLAVTEEQSTEQARLIRLCAAFKSFISVLDDYPEEDIDSLGLQQLINLVLKPVSIVPYEREAGSLHEIMAPGLLTGDCQDLLWFGFTASQSTHAIWSHWSGEELDWLAKRNVYLDSGKIMAKRRFFFLTQWLRFVKGRVIFVIPSVVNGEAAQSHAFQPFLDACFDKLHEVTIHIEQPGHAQLLKRGKVKTELLPFSPVPNFPAYWNLKNTHLLGRREKAESFNSLQKLLKYPYQWVLTYRAR
ncbi:MAG TPA: hypothetical protein VFN95_10575, partial [Flavitalea sp.]|nr:hypothetical protein [Flavitalea sp.]